MKNLDDIIKLEEILSDLKRELAANTKVIGDNTLAVEKITVGFEKLASHTGDWRKDDNKHHEKEGKLDKEKIEKMEALETAIKELIDVLKKKNEPIKTRFDL